ncbi:hypothetical protein PCCS19_19580 [Paenibacillus sp. CCS19]|uniref:DUF4349 domain-containing protein n=1 Tax=Paenibacillus sp. CCS19 TaxID=3158387 RepID=UPI0025648B4C|nr:DUF4349 domain-containing protein [Paenibacillus cellulosilyticus]GMK38904.1 hypothetical protein PCCS19_19580 [Paenibacillus cellulosilyticus]
MRTERRRGIRLVGVWLAVLLLAAGLVACSSSNDRSESKAVEMASTEAAAPQSNSAAADAAADADSGAVNTAAGQQGSGIADTSAQESFNRQVIYTANLQMQVKDFASARNAIDQLIASSGGYLLSFNEEESSNRMSGSFKIKVPAKGFNTFIDAIDKLPDKKLSKSINGEDVTEEYADLSARLKAREVAEARLISFMENAKTSKDLVAFSNELAQVQEDIERIKGRMRFIDQNVEYSTINIDMYQTLNGDEADLELNEKPGLMKKAGDSLHQSADMVVSFGKALVIIGAFLLPLLPIIAIIVLAVVIVKRRSKRKASTAQTAPPQSVQSEQTEPTDRTEQTPSDDDKLT